MGSFMKHHIFEKGIKFNMAALVFGYQDVTDGYHNVLELGLHGIFQLQFAASF
jgi:hypothetical protein